MFTSDYLSTFDIVMIITALPFEFTTKTEVTTELTFTEAEITALHQWVLAGGSLLVFSEHAPFDQAINPQLQCFEVSSNVGTIADPIHYDSVISLGGSALTGEGYTKLLQLSTMAENREYPSLAFGRSS